jgi:hypothetical protein
LPYDGGIRSAAWVEDTMKAYRYALLILLWAPAAAAQSLSPEARQTAGIIGIVSTLDQFDKLRTAPPSLDTVVQKLVLQQQMTTALLDAVLDVDAVIVSIQREETQIQHVQNRLSMQRDRVVGLATLGSTIAGSGAGIIGNSLALSKKTTLAGNAVSVGSGVAATVLSLLAIRLERGGRGSIEVSPNMLARLLGRPSEDISLWPDDVWNFLNAVPAQGTRTQTRLESLKETWTLQGRISLQKSAASEAKIAFLTSSSAEARSLSLDNLFDRSTMLADTRAQVALMKRDLAELVKYLR